MGFVISCVKTKKFFFALQIIVTFMYGDMRFYYNFKGPVEL